MLFFLIKIQKLIVMTVSASPHLSVDTFQREFAPMVGNRRRRSLEKIIVHLELFSLYLDHLEYDTLAYNYVPMQLVMNGKI